MAEKYHDGAFIVYRELERGMTRCFCSDSWGIGDYSDRWCFPGGELLPKRHFGGCFCWDDAGFGR